MFKNTTDLIKKDFTKYLDSLGLSAKSHKNYRSDLSHFLGWAILKIRAFGSYAETLSEIMPFLSPEMAREYKKYMIANKHPVATVNRRLSSLRHLARYLVASQIVSEDFTLGIENISLVRNDIATAFTVVHEFKSHLEAEKVSRSTVKNYTSDVNDFLTWLENFQKASSLKH
jgi:site-specific recombinase XerD